MNACRPSPTRSVRLCPGTARLMAVLVAVAMACVGCSTTIDPNYLRLLQSESQAPLDDVPSANTLGPSDKITISVYNEESLQGDYVISPDGTISFPLVGKLSLNGMTCSQVEDTIAQKLRDGYIRRPSVSCSVTEFNSKKVSVFGEVKAPGNFRFEDRMSIVQAVTSAGGFTERASPSNTTLVRVVQGKKVKVRVPMESIIEGEVENLQLQPGDIIFVPTSIY